MDRARAGGGHCTRTGAPGVAVSFRAIEIGGRWYVLCLLTGRWSREQTRKHVHGVAALCESNYHDGAHP